MDSLVTAVKDLDFNTEPCLLYQNQLSLSKTVPSKLDFTQAER